MLFIANKYNRKINPGKILGEVEINDEVTVFSSELLSYGGFSALVIQTPRATLTV